jgi:hypothetical protein
VFTMMWTWLTRELKERECSSFRIDRLCFLCFMFWTNLLAWCAM